MKNVERIVVAVFGLIFFLAVVNVIDRLLESKGWKPMAAADWAAWVGAIGTIGALIGTIWIATRESSRRNANELQVAQLHAAAITLPLVRARNGLEFVEAILTDVARNPPTWDVEYRRVRLIMESITLPSMAELALMVPLPGGCAAKIAAARAQIDHAIGFLDLRESGVLDQASADPRIFAEKLAGLMVRAHALLSDGLASARAARLALGLANLGE